VPVPLGEGEQKILMGAAVVADFVTFCFKGRQVCGGHIARGSHRGVDGVKGAGELFFFKQHYGGLLVRKGVIKPEGKKRLIKGLGYLHNREVDIEKHGGHADSQNQESFFHG